MNEQPPAILANQLGRRFGRRRVLHELQMEIPAGSFVGLYGSNGAGKTTLLRILCGLARPTAGRCMIFGQNPMARGGAVRARLGFLSHQGALYPELTAHENLALYARLYGVADPHARAAAMLEGVGLGARAGDRVRHFSRGMLQRMALARSLLHEPDLLLLDEPFTGLDPAGVDDMGARLSALYETGKTILMTTHDLQQGRRLSSHLALLERGGLALFGPSIDDLAAEIAERLRGKPL